MTRALLLLVLLAGCGPDDRRDPSPSPAVDTSDGAGVDSSPRGERDESPAIIRATPAALRQDECEPALLGERCPLCGPLECSPGVWTCEEGRMICGARRWSA